MKIAVTVAVVTLALSASTTLGASDAVAIAPDCTQDQRTFVNTLLQQDKNPFRPCATRVGGDITTLSTSRLCPIAECKIWIDYMAGNAPNCVYDDTNYSTSYLAKAKDCGSDIGNSTTTVDGDATPKPVTAGSTAGTEPDAGTPTTTRPPLSSSSRGTSGSGSKEDENTIEVPISSIPTVTVPDSPSPTTTMRTPAPSVTPSSGAAALSAVATLCVVALSAVTLAF